MSSSSRLPYICNNSQIDKIHAENTTLGTYCFIRKKGEVGYHAYRRLDNEGTECFYIQTHLPTFLFKELIVSGIVDKVMNKT